MLTGMQVLFLGGDARQVEVIRKLNELDASVFVCGFETCSQDLGPVTFFPCDKSFFAAADVLILPAAGTDDQGEIAAPFGNSTLILTNELAEQLPKHAVIYTGMARPYLKQLCEDHKLKLVELFERDDVAIYNSVPTAEGALKMAIENTDFTIHNSSSIVLGFGRTGFTMARALQALGSKVKVGVRRSEHYARAFEMGLEPFYINDFQHHVSKIDLIFNTIPTMIVTAQIIAKMPMHAVIIDLASKPGGTDFRFAEKQGIKALLAPGLPGIVAPLTAGRIIADCLVQLMMDDISNRRNE